MNVWNVVGRIGKDAVVRSAGGTPVAGWSLAVDSGYGDRKQTTWVDCSLWGDRAEKLAQYIRKGDRIALSGEHGTREHDGKTYTTLKVTELTLLGEKKEGGGTSGARGGAPQRDRTSATRPAADEFESDSIPFVTSRSAW